MNEKPGAVHVRIEYSAPALYRERAASLGRRLQERHDFRVEVELVESRGVAFEVSVEDRLVYSRRATRRFPEYDEIAYHVQAAGKSRS